MWIQFTQVLYSVNTAYTSIVICEYKIGLDKSAKTYYKSIIVCEYKLYKYRCLRMQSMEDLRRTNWYLIFLVTIILIQSVWGTGIIIIIIITSDVTSGSKGEITHITSPIKTNLWTWHNQTRTLLA